MMNTVTMVPRSTNRAPVGKEAWVGLRLGLGVGGKKGGCESASGGPSPSCVRSSSPTSCSWQGTGRFIPGSPHSLLTRDGDENHRQHQQRQLHARAHQRRQDLQEAGRAEHVAVHLAGVGPQPSSMF